MDKLEDFFEFILGAACMLVLVLIIYFFNYFYELKDFKICYDNSFKYKWCEQYKNY